MCVRWSFVFEEGHISVEVRDEEEDLRIANGITITHELLYIPSQGKDAYVNLNRVKLIMREEIDEKAEVAHIEPASIDNQVQDSGSGSV